MPQLEAAHVVRVRWGPLDFRFSQAGSVQMWTGGDTFRTRIRASQPQKLLSRTYHLRLMLGMHWKLTVREKVMGCHQDAGQIHTIMVRCTSLSRQGRKKQISFKSQTVVDIILTFASASQPLPATTSTASSPTHPRVYAACELPVRIHQASTVWPPPRRRTECAEKGIRVLTTMEASPTRKIAIAMELLV